MDAAQRPTKRQHYVPRVYLKNFTDVASGALHVVRRSTESPVVPYIGSPGSESFESWTYSRTDPEGAEAHFQEFESDLTEALRAAASPKAASGQGHLIAGSRLLIQASVMYARNPVHDPGASHPERFDAYQRWSDSLFQRVVLGSNGDPPSPDESLEADDVDREAALSEALQVIGDRWDWHLFAPPPGEHFYASDTPSRLFGHGCAFLWIWPVAPHLVFVAATREGLELEKRGLSVHETGLVNGLTTAGTLRKAYSSRPWTVPDLKALSDIWGRHDPFSSSMGDLEWTGAYPVLDRLHGFDIVRLR